MDIDSLRSFLAFVDTGSFTRAAKQIHRTQSAISMQMKKLEEELDKNLFTKEGRHLVLSHEGQQLASYAKRIVGLHDETINAIRTETAYPALHLGCPDDYAESILPVVIGIIRESLSKINIQVTCASSFLLRQGLDKGELHLAILTRSPNLEEGYLLKTDEGVWIGSKQHVLLEHRPLPVALFQPDCKFHSAALTGLMKNQIPYDLVSCSSSASAQRGMVRHGLAIGAMARSSLSEDLYELDETWLPPLPAIHIVLVPAVTSHPALSDGAIKKISESFQNNANK
ncbi:LysR family transcriptional regulator [Photobacterium profundum]|uniref:Putative transcriptional regulator, LysR family protein n=1 Tax=Photobacterium profundum 3TCK TaxID=314280 RepID=Q1Z6I2_9GAMM|nr:LysR family transcriptional regulator [Photobacterium profundum]EAS44165.1 putative transcriptional regulator, LysR family protein [Photobacterium profundum 3TCK]PSV59833.1 LysR family transcriptional regulator [Photobacterium profundum]